MINVHLGTITPPDNTEGVRINADFYVIGDCLRITYTEDDGYEYLGGYHNWQPDELEDLNIVIAAYRAIQEQPQYAEKIAKITRAKLSGDSIGAAVGAIGLLFAANSEAL